MKKSWIPLKSLTGSAKLNLFIVAIITFYLLPIGREFFFGNLCTGVAFDFCAFWSSGKIINEYGFPYIYDADKLFNIQKEVYPQASIDPNTFEEAFILYLPPFLIPFIFLSKLHISLSFIVWTIINLLVLLLYLKFFIQNMLKEKIQLNSFSLVLMSLPVFLNFYFGQVNIWLAIFIGEFLRAINQEKYMKGGIWLGGLLLKPQLLILLIPMLMVRKQWKILQGFLISSFFIGILSLVLIGKSGLLGLLNTIYISSQGAGHSNPGAMMNFRMLGIYLDYFSNDTLGSLIVTIGIVSTIIYTIYVFSRPLIVDSYSISLFTSGLLSATCLVTWHSHIHMSSVLIPPLVLLLHSELNKKTILSWFLIPPSAFIFIYLVAVLVGGDLLPRSIMNYVDFFLGSMCFIVNLFLHKQMASEYVILSKKGNLQSQLMKL